MKLGVLVQQTLRLDCRVDLGRGDTRVAQHFLNCPQVCTTGQKVGCERVPQQMRLHILRNAGAPRVFLHDKPQCDP
jgi:hypothetical protein